MIYPRIVYIWGKKRYNEKLCHLGIYLKLLKLENIGEIHRLRIIPVDYSEMVDRVYELGAKFLRDDEKENICLDDMVDSLPNFLYELERSLILEALGRCDWNQGRTAGLLGISARVLNYKIKNYGMTHSSWRVNRSKKMELAVA